MKSAQISEILEIWCELYNTRWEKIKKRLGDNDYELLIGETELKNSFTSIIENMEHIIIDLSNNNNSEFKIPITSFNSEKFSKKEIVDLITSKIE